VPSDTLPLWQSAEGGRMSILNENKMISVLHIFRITGPNERELNKSVFANFFVCGPFVVSKNNHETFHSGSRKCRVSGR